MDLSMRRLLSCRCVSIWLSSTGGCSAIVLDGWYCSRFSSRFLNRIWISHFSASFSS